MIRLTDMTLIAIAIGGAIWTFQIKHQAELSAKHLNKLRADIERQNEKIVLLEADWAIITSPDYLDPIARRYQSQLGLKEMESTQIVSIDELPPIRAVPEPEEVLAEGGAVDSIQTGGIGDGSGRNLTIPRRRPIFDNGGSN